MRRLRLKATGAVLGLAFTLAGCASHQPVHPALAPEDAPAGTVVLIREAQGARANAPLQVQLDGRAVAALVAGHWTRLRLSPGVHEFSAAAVDDPERRPNFQDSQPGFVRETSGVGPSKAVRLELGADETQYLLLRYDRTDATRVREGQGIVEDTRVLFAVEQLAESTGRLRMKEYAEVSVEHP